MKYFNKQFHKGFTLAELMVCLALISIIATLMMPAISKLKPNKNKIMFKKAYSITERVVSELIDDNDLYPTGDEYQGFDNTTEVYSSDTMQAIAKSSSASETDVKNARGAICSGSKKFACLFMNKLDLGNVSPMGAARLPVYGEEEVEGVTDSTGSIDPVLGTFDGEPTFYTSDGVAWVLPYTDFKPTSSYQVIYVDVNGKQNGPNCYDSDFNYTEVKYLSNNYDNNSNNNKCAQPDRFKIYVRADGKMKIEGAAAKAYLGTTNLTGNKEKGIDLGGPPSPSSGD